VTRPMRRPITPAAVASLLVPFAAASAFVAAPAGATTTAVPTAGATVQGEVAWASSRAYLARKDDPRSLTLDMTCVLPKPADHAGTGEILATTCEGTVLVRLSHEKNGNRYSTPMTIAAIDVSLQPGKNAVALGDLRIESLSRRAKPTRIGLVTTRLTFQYRQQGASWADDLYGKDHSAVYFSASRIAASTGGCGFPGTYKITTRKAPKVHYDGLELSTAGRLVSTLDTTARWSSRKSLDAQFWYVATAPVKISLNGAVYRLRKGSEFALQCATWGNGGPTSRKKSPVLFLVDGRVDVSGTPKGAHQQGIGVRTYPGFVGSESRRPVMFSVTSTGHKITQNKSGTKVYMIARSQRGALSAFQAWKLDPSAHCTAGTGIKMYMNGRTVHI